MVRRSCHETDRNPADLGAIAQEPLVLRGGVFAAQVQAMIGRLGTNAGALAAVFDASLRFMIWHFMSHDRLLYIAHFVETTSYCLRA